jgi:hypothetical protein
VDSDLIVVRRQQFILFQQDPFSIFFPSVDLCNLCLLDDDLNKLHFRPHGKQQIRQHLIDSYLSQQLVVFWSLSKLQKRYVLVDFKNKQ